MSELQTFFHGSDTQFGIFYPTDYLIAVFPGFAEAFAARLALLDRSFSNECVVAVPGLDVVEHASELLHESGLWHVVMAEVSRLIGSEAVYAEQDLEMAKQGRGFLAAHCPSEAEKRRAWKCIEIFKPISARHYSNGGIELFTGEEAAHTHSLSER